jgi:hypothetical protein
MTRTSPCKDLAIPVSVARITVLPRLAHFDAALVQMNTLSFRRFPLEFGKADTVKINRPSGGVMECQVDGAGKGERHLIVT